VIELSFEEAALLRAALAEQRLILRRELPINDDLIQRSLALDTRLYEIQRKENK
jgi:hypothetical protein